MSIQAMPESQARRQHAWTVARRGAVHDKKVTQRILT